MGLNAVFVKDADPEEKPADTGFSSRLALAVIGCTHKPRAPPISRNNMSGEQKSVATLSNTRQLYDILHSSLRVALLPDSSRALLSTAIPPLLPYSIACSAKFLFAP